MSERITQRLMEVFNRKSPPEAEHYLRVLSRINKVLSQEEAEIRPYSSSGEPGGLVYLKHGIPTIIAPDIHARMGFFLSILFTTDDEGLSNMEKLASDELQMVCVGDGFHSEGTLERWQSAFEEYKGLYKKHKHMDDEMRESLGVMEMVMESKIAFPQNFHFLKGNHENISNERGGGNFPFRKYAYEGPMVLDYIKKFYGDTFLERYYTFEKKLPLLTVGENFLISHAEPATYYDKETLIEYRENPEVVVGLTWTDNDDAEDGSVSKMLRGYLPNNKQEKSYYFGGHRPVSGLFNSRANGKYIQIHNPRKFVIAYIQADRDIDLDADIIEVEPFKLKG